MVTLAFFPHNPNLVGYFHPLFIRRKIKAVAVNLFILSVVDKAEENLRKH